MEDVPNPKLVNGRGDPVAPRIEIALTRLLPHFQRRYPALRDDLVRAEVVDEAARRIAERERRSGPVNNIHTYAWSALRHSIATWFRRESQSGHRGSVVARTQRGGARNAGGVGRHPEQIEQEILLARGDGAADARRAVRRDVEGRWLFERGDCQAARHVSRGRGYAILSCEGQDPSRARSRQEAKIHQADGTPAIE